jgi:hypothetical protein
MGREVRRVPADWQHPKNEYDRYMPLYPGERYKANAEGFFEKANAEGLQEAIDWYGQAPDQNDYMPDWPESERTHYMMYEDTSEGTPISPAFATPEELAHWLADTGASSFGSQTASYEGWLRVAQGGWAPSAVSIGGGPPVSGVDAL